MPLRGVAKAALYCAHRTSTFLLCAFREQEGWSGGCFLVLPIPYFLFKGGLVDPRLRASNEHILIVRVPEQEEAKAAHLLPLSDKISPHQYNV
jgi:hypothetical protein